MTQLTELLKTEIHEIAERYDEGGKHHLRGVKSVIDGAVNISGDRSPRLIAETIIACTGLLVDVIIDCTALLAKHIDDGPVSG